MQFLQSRSAEFAIKEKIKFGGHVYPALRTLLKCQLDAKSQDVAVKCEAEVLQTSYPKRITF